MKTFIGTGVGQPEAAVHQAVQGLTSPSAILFMASYEHFKETASRLKEPVSYTHLTLPTKLEV